MKKLSFKIPLYDVDVTLVQQESKDDWKAVHALMTSMKCKEEHIESVRDYIERGCFNGGDTFYNFDLMKVLVLFYFQRTERIRAKLYSHEKRHIEDRVLQFASVDDIESAGLLAGFLGEKFYDFEKLVKGK